MPSETGRWQLSPRSAQVQSPWAWRGFLFMALIALGLAIGFWSGGRDVFGAAWTVISGAWLAVAMRLWRRHHLATSC